MQHKVQIFDRVKGESLGEIAIPDTDFDATSQALPHIQAAARLAIATSTAHNNPENVHASLMTYETTTKLTLIES